MFKVLHGTTDANKEPLFLRVYASRSLTDVVNELTQNKDLKAVMSYIFGIYGKIPKEASFSMHSLIVCHYLKCAWYLKGGASEIAYHRIPIIEKAGVQDPVNRILLNDAKEAIGNTSNIFPHPTHFTK